MDWRDIPVGCAMQSCSTSWVMPDRLTGVDIMCVSNSSRMDDKHSRELPSPVRASMPYKPTKSFNSLPKGATHFQRFKLDDGRRTQHENLKEEKYLFYL